MIFTFPPNQMMCLCSSLGFAKKSEQGVPCAVLLSFGNNELIPLLQAAFQKVFSDTSINVNAPLLADSFSAWLPCNGYKDGRSWSVIWIKKYESIVQKLSLSSLVWYFSFWNIFTSFLLGQGFCRLTKALHGYSLTPGDIWVFLMELPHCSHLVLVQMRCHL